MTNEIILGKDCLHALYCFEKRGIYYYYILSFFKENTHILNSKKIIIIIFSR